ncbi:MAG TPA: hypothetical protein VKM55_10080 [Candidatus Lokiarchaeia archaeon]|nr:hypothetical protein [Candidatus Lokiarchaeia archaeon]
MNSDEIERWGPVARPPWRPEGTLRGGDPAAVAVSWTTTFIPVL